MLSIEETRKFLSDDLKDIPDEKVEEITSGVYELVEIILDEYIEQKLNKDTLKDVT